MCAQCRSLLLGELWIVKIQSWVVCAILVVRHLDHVCCECIRICMVTRCIYREDVTHVIIFSSPQLRNVKMLFSCARQTARGRRVVMSHIMTHPSASPVSNRRLF
jgi:hypothetical protein